MRFPGVMYALASGVLTSGFGSALWYRIVRHISSQQAATLQLSAPIIVLLAGVRIFERADIAVPIDDISRRTWRCHAGLVAVLCDNRSLIKENDC